VYAVPPHTKVEPLQFEDVRFSVEDFADQKCERCGATDTFLEQSMDDRTGERHFLCSDTGYCDARVEGRV